MGVKNVCLKVVKSKIKKKLVKNKCTTQSDILFRNML